MSSQRRELVYGFHPVRELLRHRPQTVAEILVARDRAGKRAAEVERLARRHGIKLRDVAEGELRERIGAGTHNGLGAVLLTSGEEDVTARGDSTLVVLVEDVQDPRNRGALLRVCEGAGVGKVLVRDRGSAPFSPTVTRSSAGASEWLELERITNSGQEIEKLKADGYWVYGAIPGGAPPWEIDLQGPIVLCVGGEEKGLRARTRKLCDASIGLPMRGRVESLNLATAASALLYEAVRQRTAEDVETGGTGEIF